MLKHEVKVRGSRYFVFNEDCYDASGGMLDCELITDDFNEAESLAIELSNKEYYPEGAGLFDLHKRKYHSYFQGKRDKRPINNIKFI